MGGGSKKQTVGYKYYLGMHMILCHGPIDKFRWIKVAEKIAWQGDFAGGQININAPNLFGGESSEGGISGAVDLEFGKQTQGTNSYLARLGSLLPAYRGVVGVVLRQCYIGLNPYLKKWSFRAQRIHVRQNGLPQWYDTKSQIGSLWKEPQAIYMALDYSGSMDAIMGNGKTRLENLQEAANLTIDYINDLRTYSGVRVDLYIQKWGGSTSSSSFLNLSDSSAASAKAFVSSFSDYLFGTDFRLGVNAAASFFGSALSTANRTVIFATDGEPDPSLGTEWQQSSSEEAAATIFAIPGVSSYCFNIDETNTHYTEILDNTPSDGVPVMDGSDPDAMKNALVFALGGHLDMNPAHIIRECLTDPEWGMGYQDADVDDDSFMEAADRLFSEGMGISLLWSSQTAIEEFINQIIKHISATLYVSRTTGKFVLKLIRRDYSEEDLLIFDDDSIEKVENAARPAFGELVNSVTVNYWDSSTGETGSLTIQDQAMIQMQGGVINTTIQYPGFSNSLIASKVCLRDLRTLSVPLFQCSIQTNRKGAQLNIGDVFKMRWPLLDVDDLVMRVTAMALGDGRSNKVKITCVQDVFAFPETAVSSPPVPAWEDPSQPPTPALYRVAVEAPYYELVQRLGQTDADSTLATNSDAGYLLASAARPGTAVNARLWVDSGAGFEDTVSLDFSPHGILASGVSFAETTFTFSEWNDFDQVKIGSHAQVGQELVRIDSINTSLMQITVGRAVLDTVPAEHAVGSVLLAWDVYADSDQTEYVTGESIAVKITPASGSGTVSLSAAATDTVVMAQRAQRPYPPGKLQINGEAYPQSISGLSSLEPSWAHRDRLLQTVGELQDTTVGDIGPEAGTTYNLRVYGEVGALILEETGLTVTTYLYDIADEIAFCELPATGVDPYFALVTSLLHLNGANDSTVFTDEKSLAWTRHGSAKISTAQSKFGGASLYLNSEFEASWGSGALLLHFDGANGSSTVTDTSPNPKTVSNTSGMVISTAQSKFGGSSLYSDGTGTGSVSAATSRDFTLGTGDFTIELWAKPATDCPTCYLLSNQTSFGVGAWILEPTHTVNPGKWCFFGFGIASTGTPLASTSNSLTDAWQHVAITRSGTTLRMFINGILEDSYTTSASVDSGSTNPIYINPTGSRYKGYLDEVRILKGVCKYTADFTVPANPFRDVFNGDYIGVDTADSAFGFGTGDFTVECFIYPTSITAASSAIMFESRTTSVLKSLAFFVAASTKYLSMSSDDGTVSLAGSTAVTLSAWSHVALVRSGGVVKGYLNGVEQFSSAYAYDMGSALMARIGTSNKSMSAFIGHIDEFEVTKTAKYTAAFTPPTAPFADGSGGFRQNGRLRVELESERGALLSLQKHDYTVLREGYGFNYGELYGGS